MDKPDLTTDLAAQRAREDATINSLGTSNGAPSQTPKKIPGDDANDLDKAIRDNRKREDACIVSLGRNNGKIE